MIRRRFRSFLLVDVNALKGSSTLFYFHSRPPRQIVLLLCATRSPLPSEPHAITRSSLLNSLRSRSRPAPSRSPRVLAQSSRHSFASNPTRSRLEVPPTAKYRELEWKSIDVTDEGGGLGESHHICLFLSLVITLLLSKSSSSLGLNRHLFVHEHDSSVARAEGRLGRLPTRCIARRLRSSSSSSSSSSSLLSHRTSSPRATTSSNASKSSSLDETDFGYRASNAWRCCTSLGRPWRRSSSRTGPETTTRPWPTWWWWWWWWWCYMVQRSSRSSSSVHE